MYTYIYICMYMCIIRLFIFSFKFAFDMPLFVELIFDGFLKKLRSDQDIMLSDVNPS